MGKLFTTLGLMVVVGVLLGCLPLSVVGTSTEEVVASRQEQKVEPVEQTEAEKPVSMEQETPEVDTVETKQVEESRTYTLGERGPAGGFVFYDKGSYSDGWRYMEIAPEEAEFGYMAWGAGGTVIGETSVDIGSGLENTKLIVSILGSADPKSGKPYPALLCDQLVYNNFTDWFLPSLEELKALHKALIVNQMGDFPVETNKLKTYWSSSEDNASGTGAFAFYLLTHSGDTSSASKDFLGNAVRPARRF